MVFSSVECLFYFLPIAMLLYFAVPFKFKNAALLFVSLFFYAWGEPKYIILMLISVTLGYLFGLAIEKTRGSRASAVLMWISVGISASFLLYYKYADFFITNTNALFGSSIPLLKVALPIGISFYTFQLISYTVDVYRGGAAQRSLIDLAAYIAMFPQLIAGPIVRYSDIAEGLKARTHSIDKIAAGVRRFTVGLGKKILIANVLGELCDAFRNTDERSVLFVWLYAAAYALHVYYDFSGYSDMAIGLGKVFGFDFMENFNYPYISRSATEFWRRWHMSLGTWFRDYIYIPMGGNRVSRSRWFFNILVVWMFTGFWHGAEWNFIIWGLYFAVLLVAEKLFLGKFLGGSGIVSRVLSHVYLLLAAVISFMIFDSVDLSLAVGNIAGMFGLGALPAVNAESLYCLRSYGLILIIAAVGATPIVKNAAERLGKSEVGLKIRNVLEPVCLLAVMVTAAGYLADGSFNPFLYFRF